MPFFQSEAKIGKFGAKNVLREQVFVTYGSLMGIYSCMTSLKPAHLKRFFALNRPNLTPNRKKHKRAPF